MQIIYANARIEKICTKKGEMQKFFSYDKTLVESLQTLIGVLEGLVNIDNMVKFSGYNYERVKGTPNAYSLRIIPKKNKSPYRLYLTREENGIKIVIIDIDKHMYKIRV